MAFIFAKASSCFTISGAWAANWVTCSTLNQASSNAFADDGLVPNSVAALLRGARPGASNSCDVADRSNLFEMGVSGVG